MTTSVTISTTVHEDAHLRASRQRVRRLAGATAVATTPATTAATASATTPASVTATNGTVGWNSCLDLDQLSYLTDGVSTRKYSSFDRQQDYNDSYNNLSPALGGGVLLAAHRGPGEIDSIWMTGSVSAAGDLRIVLDGKAVVDASAADIFSGSLGAPFVFPLVANNSQSSGGYYIDVPMTFISSMQVSTGADPGYYQVDYRTFPTATGVSTFNLSDSASDVLGMLDEAGYSDPKGAISGEATSNGTFQLMSGQSTVVAGGTGNGSGQITALMFIPHLSHPTATPITDDGRAFGAGGSSRFTVSLNPANTGIRVTRRYDPSVGNQIANMTVDGVAAGQWNSGAATAAPGQWADQTLDAPASATSGDSSATIVNSFVSSAKDFNEFTYWVYQELGGVWQLADTVDVGPENQATESAHDYLITDQTWSGTQVYSHPLPGAVTDNGYAFGAGGSSTFTAKIDPADTGVQLTRRSDPSVADQVAAVSVDGTAIGDWTANPAEPGGTWLDESLEIPASVTAGKSSSSVHTTFVSSQIDFNEFSYWIDSHVSDGLERTDEFSVGNSASAAAHDYSVTGQCWSRSRTYTYSTEDQALSSARIEISFDGVQTVNAPLGEFFGSATDTETRSLMSSIGARACWHDDVQANYSTTALWYGGSTPTETETETDSIAFGNGNNASEQAHDYTAGSQASADSFISDYEGNDGIPADITQCVDDGSATGTFTLQMNPSNRGVVLQRTSDQDAAGQSADVSVDDTDLGTWLEPLANPNHRWLDDQFDVPASVSAGQSSITVRVSPAAGSPWLAAGYETLSILPGRVRAVRDGGLHPGRAPRRRTYGSARGDVRLLHPEQI